MKYGELTLGQIEAVVNKLGGMNGVNKLLSGELVGKEMENQRQTSMVIVDYSQTLAQMIKAGNYGWVNNDITQEHFPIAGSGKQEEEIVLFCFGKNISSGDAIAEMEKQGFRPARIEELLALGAAYPGLQKQFPIVALGSVWQDPVSSRLVPYLNWFSDERLLHLLWFEGGWGGDWRFAAVRK
ncbi:MAG: hypothetical protein COU42_02245 [Candidatus Nealsonbacteria bacterium CG10_big_fil_rev_8_21_14_0_10_36_24]|uniref:Uncharacterized protein n=2 Tax=Candidatus Nealsoniibacteriota TaxID=1817911 RepID=A0A2H0YP41_9BACT|nr:MAG: hypothetical protein COU42_02245 [Candidatus Nealsonbacteria bacterium CG10_big_fil_rev_8_21_14_0_10_36_24]PIS40267.1 MAG: hypothetical protein COT32_00765 [Candidatus Nealsonbacteria bacterium CG08_land_8_20_14_0_20_36_22]